VARTRDGEIAKIGDEVVARTKDEVVAEVGWPKSGTRLWPDPKMRF